MGGNHTIIIIAALVIFSLIAMNANRNIMYSSERTLHAEYVATSVSIGQRLIREISSRSFDENTINGNPTDETGFSSTLGSDDEDDFTSYDDVDDFDGFSTTVTSAVVGSFLVECDVDYVVENSPEDISGARTRTKRITVRVMPDIVESGTLKKDTVSLYYFSSY